MVAFRRSHGAALGTAALAVLAALTVMWLGDRPLGRRRPDAGHDRRAAVAIRDHVIPFQKWGSQLFTLPALEAAYHEVHYLTEPARGQGQDALLAAIRDAAADHEVVDLFLLAHTNFMIDWIATLPPEVRGKLRLVYNTGCGDGRQGRGWLALGADTYVGHDAPRSLSPVFYLYFLRRWVRGYDVVEATTLANARVARRLDLVTDDRTIDARAAWFGAGQTWIGSE